MRNEARVRTQGNLLDCRITSPKCFEERIYNGKSKKRSQKKFWFAPLDEAPTLEYEVDPALDQFGGEVRRGENV